MVLCKVDPSRVVARYAVLGRRCRPITRRQTKDPGDQAVHPVDLVGRPWVMDQAGAGGSEQKYGARQIQYSQFVDSPGNLVITVTL